MKGYITKGIGGFYYVKTPEGIVECKPRGIFRKQVVNRRVELAGVARLETDPVDKHARRAVAHGELYAVWCGFVEHYRRKRALFELIPCAFRRRHGIAVQHRAFGYINGTAVYFKRENVGKFYILCNGIFALSHKCPVGEIEHEFGFGNCFA